jgi:hypothetical protein
MKSSFLLAALCVFVIHLNTSAQDAPISSWKAFKIDPSGVFNITNPSIQLGFEMSFAPSWTFQVEGGPLLDYSIWTGYKVDNREDVRYSGYRVGVEVRHYVQEKYYSPFHGIYVGANLYFLSNQYTDKTEWGNEVENPENYEINYDNENWRTTDVDKQEIGFTIRCGHQLESKIPLGIELYTGLGIKRKMVKYSDISPALYEDQVQIENSGIVGAENEGTYYRLSIPLGLRLVISF